ncbi:hypothetical protein Poly30_53060 [Planctomycetes bacterium Poly30]|uniref:Uncharacterized protein n=1 Tax=Saltatorellus ferox TaxID=2528018 RepID=A0A518F083_9BACT|nr:hypothetical protein Poly30_53060 [Planctomycetes bacterium Poly30]
MGSSDEWEEMPFEEWVMTQGEREELEIQTRMYREGARAVREEVEWLEKHNFPIWIWHEEKVVDARTLPDEVRAKHKNREFDLFRPAMLLRPKTRESDVGSSQA